MRFVSLAVILCLVGACGGGGDNGTSSSNGSGNGNGSTGNTSYTIGGSVSGLTGTVVLQDNGGNNLTLNTNGGFTFSAALASGGRYSVSVQTQPAQQTCVVSDGAGTLGSANVTNVGIECTTNVYTVGGSLSGLSGSGLVLQLNGASPLAVAASATSFTFTTSLSSGSNYTVTVKTQPSSPPQSCSVSNAGGTVTGSNVSNVTVACTTNSYMVGGTVSGLTGRVSRYSLTAVATFPSSLVVLASFSQRSLRPEPTTSSR
jgi:hypothetical protein